MRAKVIKVSVTDPVGDSFSVDFGSNILFTIS